MRNWTVRAWPDRARPDGRYGEDRAPETPRRENSLDALCTRYGIDRSHRTKHGALLDAELLAQVYVELLGGRQIGMELAAQAVVAIEAAATPALPARERPQRPRPTRPARRNWPPMPLS
jgi:DNA polymerase III epsilon subunit-like protein